MHINDRFSEKDLEVLHARAERVAWPAEVGDQQQALKVLVISLHGEKYALPIETIRAVYEHIQVAPIPCAPRMVAGVANIRGHIVLVLNLHALLGGMLSNTPLEDATLLMLAADDLNVAFHVEAINGMASLSEPDLAPLPTNVELARGSYLRGLLSDGTAVLDTDGLLSELSLSTTKSAI